MEQVKVIIIDTGVKKEHPLIKNNNIQGFGFEQGKRVDNFEDDYGHGTALYQIIHKEEDTQITNIKIYNIQNGVSEDEIIDVLTYIYEYMDVDVINLSFGVCLCFRLQEFYDICERFKQKGVIIVSAFDNGGAISYPAAFDNVIGVSTDESCSKPSQYIYLEDEVINIAGYGRIQRISWISPDYLFLGGNSFACAHITVQVVRCLKQGAKGIQEVLNQLRENALCGYQIGDCKKEYEIPFSIHKAAVFPFNKEIHSMIRFADMLSFEIVNIYDVKYSGHIFATTRHLLQDDSVADFTIKNIDNICWNEIDTLIIGHLGEMSKHINQLDLKEKLVNDALIHGVHIISFDDDVKNLCEGSYSNEIYFPHVDNKNIPPWREGKLFKISKPVLGVFGTSSKQGKFTLQLKLRKKFLENGVNVGQIGTEPTAKLFGMDYVYPMGYQSSVYIKEYDAVHYLNYIMKDLEAKNKDIILVGSQSGSVPYQSSNLEMLPIPQINFLLGTQPDAIILCINPYDSVTYIRKTLHFIDAMIETDIIALVLFPMDLTSNWTSMYGKKEKLDKEDEKKLSENLEKEFQCPVFGMDEDEIERLFQHIVKYYEEG